MTPAMPQSHRADILVIGAGLAGIVTALQALQKGLSVILVDRATPAQLGGLARSAFGGMTLIGTPEQARMKIPDSPERALRDWLRFGELDEDAIWPRAWAQHYVEHSRAQVYDWLRRFDLRFLPAVNWVERGLDGEGNSLPRYHILWGTGQHLTLRLIQALQAAAGKRLTLLHQHRVDALERRAGRLCGALAID